MRASLAVNTAGALESVERILNRGGEPAEVVGAVLDALRERGFPAELRSAEEPAGPDATSQAPIVHDGQTVALLAVTGGDEPFARRVALLISPYVDGPGADDAARRAPAPPSS